MNIKQEIEKIIDNNNNMFISLSIDNNNDFKMLLDICRIKNMYINPDTLLRYGKKDTYKEYPYLDVVVGKEEIAISGGRTHRDNPLIPFFEFIDLLLQLPVKKHKNTDEEIKTRAGKYINENTH